MNPLYNELRELKKIIIYFVCVFFLLFGGLLILTPKEIIVGSMPIVVLVPGTPTLATHLFFSAKISLVPEGIPVVALGPVSSFVAPITMAFLVALLIIFPFGLYLIIRFLRPALRLDEQKTLSLFVVPSLILFYLGCALAYFIIIPRTFAILYSFAVPMGVEPFFALDNFVASVFFLTISVGFAFLLPVFMVVSSHLGLIPHGFFIRHFRGALVSTIIFSAIVTPDGSGVTMVFLALPLLCLYGIGATVVAFQNKKHI